MTFSIGKTDEKVKKLESGKSTGEIDWVEEAMNYASFDSKEQLKAAMKRKKEQYDGLVTDDGAAAILVCRDQGVQLPDEIKNDPRRFDLDIENIVGGMRDVKLRKIVSRVQSTNNFDGGRVRNLTIKDSSGSTQVTAWNDDVEAFDRIEEGDEIVLKGGYTKEDMSDWQRDKYGIHAVHIGDKATLEVSTEEGYEKIIGKKEED